jgi:hypothetical protein
MINYSTEFPIDDKNSVADVLALACGWITGSPHTRIPKSAFGELPIDTEIQVTVDDESVTIGAAKTDGFEIGGVRYVRVEGKSLEWITSIVTVKTPNQHLISIQLSCEALTTAARLPTPKKPIIVRQVINELGGGMDGSIPVANKPFFLSENEADVAAKLISGVAGNRLPLVYVSANYDGSHIVNPTQLAKLVSGMAHVVVEPSRTFSVNLKRLSASRNAYGGTVGVYWPESDARKSYFLDEKHNTGDLVQANIANDIRVAISNRRQKTNCNWLHLKEVISRCRYDKLRATGSTELDAFIEAFDSDQNAKEERINEAEQEIGRLTAELRKYGAGSQSSSSGLIAPGEEQDLYQSEIRDIVIHALQDYLKNSHDDSRRQHVIQDLLQHNKASDTAATFGEEIKSIFRSYTDMDAKTRSALAKLGFDVSEDGKHYKAVFQGDGRYTFSISKTSSDHRAGKNLASDINNKLF